MRNEKITSFEKRSRIGPMATRVKRKPRRMHVRTSTYLLLFGLLVCVGCGTNRFEQELKTEGAAIKLTNETIQGDYPLIATADLKALLDSGEKILLVDTMPTAGSYNKGHVPGAVNFVFPKVVIDEWNESTMGAQTIAEYETLLGPDKSRKIVFYCGYVTCPRSHNGAVFAQQLGYTNVYRYPGGIDAWRGAGYRLTTE